MVAVISQNPTLSKYFLGRIQSCACKRGGLDEEEIDVEGFEEKWCESERKTSDRDMIGWYLTLYHQTGNQPGDDK